MNNKQFHVTVIVAQYAAQHLHSVILNCSYLRVANENYVRRYAFALCWGGSHKIT